MLDSSINNKYPLISIQILNWNRAEETQRAIESALDQTYPNIEVIMVDNGSTDNSVALTRKNFPQVKIVELDKNYGCPGGRNRGVPFCNGDYIFYLDNDGVLHQEAVIKAYNQIEKNTNIAVIAGVVYDFDTLDEIDCKVTPKSTKVYEHNIFQGGICLHRKSIYNIIGFYPEHFTYGGEERFLTCKILDADLQIIKDESIILWHKRSDKARNRKNELLHSFYNKLYTALALFPWFNATLFLLYFPFAYMVYALKHGFGKTFGVSLFRRFPKTVKAALKNRTPINRKAYKKLKKKS